MFMDRKDLQELSRVRPKEATALLQLELFDGAYYLAGYAVECALKACIAKGTQRFEDEGGFLPFSQVATTPENAGLETVYRERADKDRDFRTNWDLVQSWSEQSRYRRHQPESARTLLRAVGDRRHGVISWIKQQW
jgi:hypothetical protein